VAQIVLNILRTTSSLALEREPGIGETMVEKSVTEPAVKKREERKEEKTEECQ
jgi:hypothetical protein